MDKNSTNEEILSELNTRGYRITKTRRSLIDIFTTLGKPLSVQELLNNLSHRRLTVNKTTVYRELEFLEGQEIIREVQLGQDRKRFELTTGSHHHHIRCIQCDKIVDVNIPNELSTAAKHIEQQTQFTVLDHSLEFVGICKMCQRFL